MNLRPLRQAVLTDAERLAARADRAVRLEDVERRCRDVLELVGDDIDRVGKAFERLFILIGRGGHGIGDLPGGPGLRVDTHITAGATIPPNYDSMIAKFIAQGADRAEALARASAALDEFRIAGISSNAALHRQLLTDPGFAEGGVNIHYLENWLARRAEHG